MTLIIAAGNHDQFIQVSDRRLTSNFVLKNDEANKAIVLTCSNARLAVGFTGLAEVGTFKTRDWLLTALTESFPPDYTAENTIRRFAERASNDFCTLNQLKNLPRCHKRLTIMLTGYLYHHDPPLGALAVVSNFQNLDKNLEEPEALDRFECFFREERRPNDGQIALFYKVGTLLPIPEPEIRKLTELVKEKKPASAIVGKLVEIIQSLADHPRAMNVIGKQLNSIILPRDRSQAAEAGYHSDIVKAESYMPDQVVAVSEKLHMAVSNISIRPVEADTPPMSGPKIGRNQPCWCGSGKKFKKCHGGPATEKIPWGLEFKADE